MLSFDVSAAFDRAAERYDLMAALNPGYHRHLQHAAKDLIDVLPSPRGPECPARVVDLGCGSGASTRALLAARTSSTPGAGDVELVGLDASRGMLSQARTKKWPPTVRFVHAPAEDLAQVAGERWLRGLDGVFAAYLFRNVGDPSAVLRQVFDVLRPGGALVVHEYSVADSPPAVRRRWALVCHGVVIPLSRLLGTDPAVYRYLYESVVRFDSVSIFAGRLCAAGFVDVQHRTVGGWQRDVLHTFRAVKPPS